MDPGEEGDYEAREGEEEPEVMSRTIQNLPPANLWPASVVIGQDPG